MLNAAVRAGEIEQSGLAAVRDFLDQTIEHGPDLMLPVHGGPPMLHPDTAAIQARSGATYARRIP